VCLLLPLSLLLPLLLPLLLLLPLPQVIAFAMGRGPLAMSHCTWTQNLLQFGVVLSTPVIPRDGEGALRQLH
jgi:hypothetical protein